MWGQGLEYWGPRGGGGKFPHRRQVPTRILINQCQIITCTFLILKSDIIENSRIELKGIVLPVPSNQIKVTFIIILPSTWYICDFFLFHIEIEGKCGWIIGGGEGMLAPTIKLLSLPPSSYAYALDRLVWVECSFAFIAKIFSEIFLWSYREH